jgi:hypothetical protein
MILTGARLRNLRAARWTPVLRNWVESAAAVIAKLKDLAPYALIELVLPGGSVMALLLWLYRGGKMEPTSANCRSRCRWVLWWSDSQPMPRRRKPAQ